MNNSTIKSIDAVAQTVRNFFEGNEYIIPEYQRPYSWDKVHCLKLWDDLYEYHRSITDGSSMAPYFLGTVVVTPGSGDDENKKNVIDGQQRIITLSLLAKALLDRCMTYASLEKILHPLERREAIIIKGKIRIEHRVFGDNENNSLEAVLLGKENIEGSNKYLKNYQEFIKIIDALNVSTSEMGDLIDTILDRTSILPIRCDDLDSALTVFETINNRGLSLRDADIFKAALYKNAMSKNEEKIFSSKWNEIDELTDRREDGYLPLQLVFTNYMHVIRGSRGSKDSVVGLRNFFVGSKKEGHFNDWEEVIESLEKIIWGWYYISDPDYGADHEIINWGHTLMNSPNAYWQYPVMTFIHKMIEKDGESYYLSQDNVSALKVLLKDIARFCYLKWLKHRNVNHLKSPTYSIVEKIYHGQDYAQDIKDNLKEISHDELKEILLDINVIKSQGARGICYLIATLNHNQDDNIPINESLHVEHILPQEWTKYKYEGWGEHNNEQVQSLLDSIANLVLLEGKINIKASNRFFKEKKAIFTDSKIAEAKDLCNYKEWTSMDYMDRKKRLHETLTGFFFPG